tara:strand:- start:74 stop:439 length:366 start_codon:yes stop_codon:yes gene_type:complete
MTKFPSDEMDATPSPRQQMLRDAEQLVSNNRNKQYGDPTENMQRTAEMMAAYLGNRTGRTLEPHDVAAFGIILKLGRLAHDPTKLDSWTDVAGYASIGYEAIKKADTNVSLSDFLTDALER